MKNATRLLAEVLKLTKRGFSDTFPYDEVDVHPTAFIRGDSPNVVRVSAEDGQGWADYYAESSESFGIDPRLVRFAEARRMFWEWENPGCIALYPV